jgi:hypothetical protein
MKKRTAFTKPLAIFLALLLGVSQGGMARSEGGDKTFKQEELDQLLAPIALYPDSLLAQIFMASTYPLEVVQAERWTRENKDLKGDALTSALEKENWDPSVKSLVNFPQVLEMMNTKLDWTQKLGDAFLAQQKDVMDTVQELRAKAEDQGNLKSNEEQKVVVEKETKTIIIESANPQVVYVPTYNPTVIYGPWWYPSYPPYYYYPPGYVAGTALLTFGVGVAVGAAWGYAWGRCNWRGGGVNVNINRNTNINHNINRGKYQNRVTNGKSGRGQWKHDPQHRKGVSYRDGTTAQKYDRGASKDARTRDAYRGHAEAGRKDLSRGGADQVRARKESGTRGSQGRPDVGSRYTGGSGQKRSNNSAFGGYERGSQARDSSSRGHQSLSSSRSGSRGGGMSRPSGGRGGGRRR